MRFVDRRLVPVPAELASESIKDARREIEAWVAQGDHERRQRRSPYDSRLVLQGEVPDAITQLFHRKCAYCETVLRHERIHLDHFRPRNYPENYERGDPREDWESHYSWLSYDWENLYPICSDCNKRKGNYFPVSGRRAPRFSTVSECRAAEQALLLDPCFDDPMVHLAVQYNGEYVATSKAGYQTLEILGLNRADLVMHRGRLIDEFIRIFAQDAPIISPGNFYHYLGEDSEFSGALLNVTFDLVAVVTGRRPRLPRGVGVVSRVVREIVRLDEPVRKRAVSDFRERRVAPVRWLTSGTDDIKAIDRPPQRRAPHASPRHIQIRNFKGIEKLDIDVAAARQSDGGAGCLMLLGENSAGKSSVLEAIALALVGVKAAHSLAEPEDVLRRKGEARFQLVDPEAAEVIVSFFEDDTPARLVVDPVFRAFEGEAAPIAVVIGYGPRRFVAPPKVRWKGAPTARLAGLFEPVAPIAQGQAWLLKLASEDPDRFYAVTRGLRGVMALRNDDSLAVDDVMGLCVSAHGRLTPIDRMSEGYRSLFAMAVDIMRELLRYAPNLESARGVVLIDEIETHLHPRWKMRVMSALRAAMPQVTFIATTHDPLCLRGMEDGEVVVLHKDARQRISMLEDLPSVRGMRAEQLLTSEYFGLNSTADPELEDRLADHVAAVGQAVAGVASGAAQPLDPERGLAETLVLGDTVQAQLVQEALKRFLEHRVELPATERVAAREAVIDRMLDALTRPLES